MHTVRAVKGRCVDGSGSCHACFRYPNGARYEGTWLDNLKHGHGVYTFPKVVPCLSLSVLAHTAPRL